MLEPGGIPIQPCRYSPFSLQHVWFGSGISKAILPASTCLCFVQAAQPLITQPYVDALALHNVRTLALAGFVPAKAQTTLTLTIQIGALRKFQWAQHSRIRQPPHMPQLIQGSLRAGEQLELVAYLSRHSRMPFFHLYIHRRQNLAYRYGPGRTRSIGMHAAWRRLQPSLAALASVDHACIIREMREEASCLHDGSLKAAWRAPGVTSRELLAGPGT